MKFIKSIISWFVKLFGRDTVDKVVELVEDKTGWNIPEESIVEFANKHLPTLLDDPEAKLWDKQEDILEKMENGEVLIEGDRRTGKTLLITLYAVYTMFKKPNTTVILRSLNSDNSKNILSKIIGLIDNVREEFNVEILKSVTTGVSLSNGSNIRVSYVRDLLNNSLDFDIFIGDEIAHWETRALESLIQKFPKFKGKLQLVTTDWDDRVNKIVDVLPETVEVVKLLVFDKDKDLGERLREVVKRVGKDGFLREFGTIFR